MSFGEKIKYITVVLFCIVLSMPLVDNIFKIEDRVTLSENRALSPFPRFDIKKISSYPSKVDAYYNDNFGFRKTMIRVNSLVNHKIIKNKNYEKAVLGSENWSFFKGEDGLLLKRHIGIDPFTDSHLKKLSRSLLGRQKYLLDRNIKYVYVIVPNKSSIYGEHLPEGYINNKGQSLSSQLSDYLKENTNLDFLDLKPSLNDAKKSKNVYFRHGTHWNDFGAYIAYREIIVNLAQYFPELSPVPENSFHEVLVDTQKEINQMNRWGMGRGDRGVFDYGILKLLDLNVADLRKFSEVQWEPKFKICSQDDRPLLRVKAFDKLPGKLKPFSKVCDNKSIRLLCFRDSFSRWLVPFLSENFGRSTYVWSKPNFNQLKKWVEAERPDVVIEIYAERNLKNLPLR